MNAHLETRGLTGGYPGITVFSDVSFSVRSGEILTIVGANGSGKSALLETLQGLLPVGGGTILLDGTPVHDDPAEQRAARGLILVSDRRRLWEEMTVGEHLRLGAFRAAARTGWRMRAARAGELFEALPSRRGARPGHLSGGFRQQLALARFAMGSPRVWLLDDPLQGLDNATRDAVLQWIRSGAQNGAAIIVTGQHVRALLELATRGMFLESGRVTEIAGGVDDPRVRLLL